ncbi:MAG: VCBS repeat-containing protein [Kofleriaceae bacterium]
MIDSATDAPPPCTTANMFGVEQTFPIGGVGVALAVDKLDQGLTLDVAVAVTDKVVILHGDGAGNFGTPSQVDTPAIGVAISDFDIVDVRKDLVIWSGNTAVIRRQDPAVAGTFLAAQPLTGPFTNVRNVSIEFFDNGNLLSDLLVQDDVDRRVYTQQAGTPGSFGRTANTTGAVGDDLVLAREIDGVFRADALFVDQAGAAKVALSSSGGQLQAVATVATGVTGHAAAFGNFDGDALPDLVIATAAGGVIFLQDPAAPGTFTQRAGTIAGVIGDALSVIDVNVDGTDDIVVPGSVVLQCPGTPGNFTQVESVSSVAPALMIDINGNGKPDLLRLVGSDLVVRLQ